MSHATSTIVSIPTGQLSMLVSIISLVLCGLLGSAFDLRPLTWPNERTQGSPVPQSCMPLQLWGLDALTW
jgi:hypothetical protein